MALLHDENIGESNAKCKMQNAKLFCVLHFVIFEIITIILHYAFCILHFLQVVRVLYRLVIGVFHKPRIAAERIGDNHRFFVLLLHILTSIPNLPQEAEIMIAFFRC